MLIETILFYTLLIDALGAVCMAYGGGRPWWRAHLGPIAKHLPLAKGWVTYYLILVLFIGWILYRTGSLILPF